MNRSLHYVLDTATPTDADKAQLREWLMRIYGIVSDLCESLAPNQDPPNWMLVDAGDAPLRVIEFAGPDQMRHAFVESVRESIRSSSDTPAFAAYMGVVYKTDIMAAQPRRVECLLIHLETPQKHVGAIYADILRTPDAAPRLAPPSIQIYEGCGASVQGGMVGYFLPPIIETDDEAIPPMSQRH